MPDIVKKINILLILSALVLGCIPALAFDASHYATESVLASGKWARISVSATGMHVVTDTQLKNLGFTDPSKVHVYGTGGRMIPEALLESMPDDLPLLPSVRTAGGIAFFATDWFSWNTAASNARVPYTHTINPYSEESYYFLSDREVTDEERTALHAAGASGMTPLTTFEEHIVHEKDLQNPGESGRLLLGEDFRTQKKQFFTFQLPDNAIGDATVAVRFAAKNTSASSSITVSANGTDLPISGTDRITSVKTDTYCQVTTSIKDVENAGDKLELGIEFSYTGALFMARLDYIEVFYTRRLAMRDGQLHFYHTFYSPEALSLEGCSASTVIWDVTEPWNPRPVNFELNGATATFTVSETGYREFMAFEPSKVTATVTPSGRVTNQNIHGLATPDMVIISPKEYLQGSQQIADFHTEHDGMTVHVLTPEDIYLEFSGGTRDVSAFRKMLKMWYDRPGDRKLAYCLIMGKPTYDPKGKSSELSTITYKPVPIWQSVSGLNEHDSYSNDDYIGMLQEGELTTMSNAMIHVAVGRIPVKSAAESLEAAAKIKKYVTSPQYGSWRNKVMIIADDGDRGIHLTQAERVYEQMKSKGNGASFLYDRLYLDTFPLEYTGVGAAYPKATQQMLSNYNDGVILTNYIGHASPSGWGHEHLWEWPSISSMTNTNLNFMLAATCRFGFWDSPAVSGAEVLLLNPDAGVIGLITASRTVYIDNNGSYNSHASQFFFERDEEGHPLRFGDIYIKGKNSFSAEKSDSNKLRYALYGDPAIRMPSPENSVSITTVNGIDVTASDAPYPEVKALGQLTLEGVVTLPDGSTASDFEGIVNLTVYDAERAITTLDNQGDGKTMTYNDRTTMLTQVNARVKEGRFSVSLRMPSEIENNYVPARITAYAYDGEGFEANGDFDRFYVYGYDDGENTDTEGPEIEKFYLNNPLFDSGDRVSANPVLFVRVSDPSGVNLSQAGIGHSMTITLDGTVYDDVNSRFTSDPEQEGAGDIVYPLTDIAPGNHKLDFTVWDNAGNVSTASIDFEVAAAMDPNLSQLTTNVNPASTDVTFLLTTGRPNTQLKCEIGVYDLLGQKVWSTSRTIQTDLECRLECTWDLCDASGRRVPRGIYLYRATVEAPEGTTSSKTKKLAVTAP